jgi:hypothetical protein
MTYATSIDFFEIWLIELIIRAAWWQKMRLELN